MGFETCPLLDELDWIKHGFYGQSDKIEKYLQGVHAFNDFPQTVFLKQKHTDQILSNLNKAAEIIADASTTTQNGFALAVKTADCCPVLLVCTHSRQIAAIHAGWPGALNQITSKTIEEMIARGAIAEKIIAAIGPSIHQETYPVQDDVRDKFMQSSPLTERHFVRFEDRWKMDVNGIVIDQLKSKGVLKIWLSRINTFTSPDYASYRRSQQTLTSRNISVIMKTEE